MEVVEIKVERGSSISASLVDPAVSVEARIGVTVVDAVDPAATATIDTDGWEIGALTVLLPTGAEIVSGIEERRIARVRAVLSALDAAR